MAKTFPKIKMLQEINKVKIIEVTPDNVTEAGIYCIKDKKAPGYHAKVAWFRQEVNKGVRIWIAMNSLGKPEGFIEYIPSELAWRPIKATNYFFIQCIALFGKEARAQGIGSYLLQQCEEDARKHLKHGICVMSSGGVWMANKSLFEKNGFVLADRLGRFELMVKHWESNYQKPRFIDWTKEQAKYAGWQLIYADQCPWHEKSVTELQKAALDLGINLVVKKLNTPEEAQHAPSGFGTFSLLKEGKLLADHYLSRTRFENIIREENRK